MLTQLLCALLLASAPAHRTALRRPVPRTAPRSPIMLNLGDVVSVNGVLYTVGVGLSPVAAPPPPTPPTITRYSPNPAVSGQPFLIIGGGFDSSAQATLNGSAIPVTLVNPTTLGATAPAVTSPVSGPVLLTATAGRATGPTMTVNPGPPPPPLTSIYGFRNGNRDWTSLFSPGQTIYIEGVAFGAVPGVVQVGGAPVTPGPSGLPHLPLSPSPDPLIAHLTPQAAAWSDTEIQIICPGTTVATTPSLTLILATGAVYHSGVQFSITPLPTRRPPGG